MAVGAAAAVIDVSVIVPVYNKGRYLPELLESLQRQTSDSFDVWLVDDGSTDGSETQCDKIAASDARFHVIHQENSGWPGKPRNVGIDASSGRYMFFADADDWCEPTLLADLVAYADEHASDIVLPSVVAEGHAWSSREPVMENAENVDLREAFLSLTPHKLFRRSYFEGLGLRFTEDKVPLEDGRLVAKAYVGGGRISRCGQNLGYHYMGRDGTNISYAPRDPAAHLGSLISICESAREAPEHSDEIIVDMYRRKLLRYLGPNFLPRLPDDLAEGYVRATAEFARRYIPAELESTLTAWTRLASRTARLDSLELSRALVQARVESAVPAERKDGHWFIGPVPADDVVNVRAKIKNLPAGPVRIVVKPDWVRAASPRLEVQGDAGSVVALAADLTPVEPVTEPGEVHACWGDLTVPVAYAGEEILSDGLRFGSRDGWLTVSPA